jgi:hypothetical protein
MTDFLTRLAQRTLGVAPVARPNLAPTLEGRMTNTEPLERGEAVESRASFRGLEPPAEPKVAPERASDVPLGDLLALPRSVVRETTIHKQVRITLDDRRVESPPASDVHTEPSTQTARPVTTPAPPSRSREMWTDAAVRDVPAERLTRDAAPSAPPITVSIGRIEIRTIARPTPPPIARRESRASDLQPLSTYLRERNGGRQ